MCSQAQVMTLLETQGQSRHPRHIGTSIPQLSALLPLMELTWTNQRSVLQPSDQSQLTPKLRSTSSPVPCCLHSPSFSASLRQEGVKRIKIMPCIGL